VSQVAAWLKGSRAYSLVERCGEIWRQSLTYQSFKGICRIISQSRTARWLSSYFHIRFRPRQAFVYRTLRKFQKRLVPLRMRVAGAVRASTVWRIAEGSFFLRMLHRLLIPLSVFFVFIDEIGRDIFGDMSLFGIWDEIYLILCVLCLVTERIMGRNVPPLTVTPMDMPIFLLSSVSFFLFLTNSRYPDIGLEGMRLIVQFTFWFYVFSRYLDSCRKSDMMTDGMILAGGILGIHGILQFMTGVEMPSNWMDAAEGRGSVRVFSIVGSPNILGSLMVQIIPLALARFLQSHAKGWRKAFYLSLMASMAACLILTLSRGAWLGLAAALTVFCIAWNPGWLAGMALLGGLALLVPQVYSRISYMLSEEYIRSSARGGRLLRYRTGWKMFMDNFWTGVGQGHFGGAVAMNHKELFPDTFYMDSYWLKTAVEMGIIGLSAYFIVIWFLFVWSVRAIRTTMDRDARLMIIGGFSGLMGIVVHNMFENVFEVPYMVIYFWMTAAIVFCNYNRGQFRVVTGGCSRSSPIRNP